MDNKPAKPVVLLVDDTTENLSVLLATLGDSYHVKVATSGFQALRICQSLPVPDLILLDVMMPEMDGIEVCRRLKAAPHTADIPVIFVTSMAEDHDESLGLQVGAADYIAKPIRPAVVRQRVRLQLELRQARQAQARLERHYKSYIPDQVAIGIQRGEVPSAVISRRRQLTVFFSDIVGFTEQVEQMHPAAMNELLNNYFEAMGEVASRHKGTLDKFIGDACMVFFGDPNTRGAQADASACVAMALDMQQRIAELQPTWRRASGGQDLRVRMGVASGPCTVGNFGSKKRMTYTVLGTPVNVAARLESSANPDELLIDQATRELIGTAYACAPQAPLLVKGIGRPLATYVVRGHNAPRLSRPTVRPLTRVPSVAMASWSRESA